MNWGRFLWPLLGVVILIAGYRAFGWPGVALAAGGLVFWLLLHMNRTMQALKRAAAHPIGYVASAVMLNAKLRPGVNLLHVIALTRSLGSQLSPKEAQPEVFLWRDASDSSVTCEFLNGRLVKWSLHRPEPGADSSNPQPQSVAPPEAA